MPRRGIALVGHWAAQHGYRPLLAESFSDRESHAGTVHKATNWTPAGLTKGYAQDHTDYYIPNDRPKKLWLKELAPHACALMCARELPAACQATVGEGELAAQQTERLAPDDLVLWDRGFTGLVRMARVRARAAHFVGRCSRASFRAALDLFRLDRAGRSGVTALHAPAAQRAELERLGLPLQLTVRFVSVRLSAGELEVLVTSLLDATAHPTEGFGELYHQRWGQETDCGRLKGRLDVESWTGETGTAVQQNFQASVFLANLESPLRAPAQAHMDTRRDARQHPAQGKRADSCHALKERVVALLAGERPAAEVVGHLQRWFVASPVRVRPGRMVPRRPPSPARSCQFQRHIRKAVYSTPHA